MMTRNTSALARARRRVAERQRRAKEALQKFHEECTTRGVPVFTSVRRAA